jgi:hypothetical protein
MNLKLKPYDIHNIQLARISFKLLKYIVSYYLNIVTTTLTPGVSQHSPSNRNLIPRFGRSSDSNRNNEQSHISSLWQHEVWMVRTKKVLPFPSCFFFRVVAPLYLEELDYFTSRDTILLIQDLDWVLGVRQVNLE